MRQGDTTNTNTKPSAHPLPRCARRPVAIAPAAASHATEA